MSPPCCVAITGVDTFFGRRLVERWSRTDSAPRIVHCDLGQTDLSERFREERVESVVHLSLQDVPGVESERGLASDLSSTQALLDACAKAGIGRLVIPSSTMCYGPRLENPQQLSEDARLYGQPDTRWVSTRVQIEQRVATFRDQFPQCDVTVLRHCWVMGPAYLDAIVRYFEADWVPTVLGHDPLLQFVHEDDVLDTLEAAALRPHPGTFNVVGDGVLPLSGYLRLAGKWNVPTPERLLRFVSDAPLPFSGAHSGRGFCDYLKYIWIASGERAENEFGPRTYSSQEAWLSMVGARRLRDYRARN